MIEKQKVTGLVIFVIMRVSCSERKVCSNVDLFDNFVREEVYRFCNEENSKSRKA